MKAVSGIKAGRTELQTTALDLYQLLDDLGAMFRLRFEEKGLAIAGEPQSKSAPSA